MKILALPFRAVWWVFLAPGLLLVWMGYLFPGKGRITQSKRQLDHKRIVAPLYSLCSWGGAAFFGLAALGSSPNPNPIPVEPEMLDDTTLTQVSSDQNPSFGNAYFYRERTIVESRREPNDTLVVHTASNSQDDGNDRLYVLSCSERTSRLAAESLESQYVVDVMDALSQTDYALPDLIEVGPSDFEQQALIKLLCPT